MAMRSLLMLLFILCTRQAHAAAEAGQPGAYLRAGVGARAAAMGNAYAALAEGPDAVVWNPAGLALSRRPGLASTYNLLSLGRQFSYAGLVLAWEPQNSPATPLASFPMAINRSVGAWGLGWLSFSLGNDFEGRVADTSSYYTFGDRQSAYLLSHGRALLPWLAVGGTFKLYERVLERYSARGQGLDLGILMLLGENIRLGVTSGDLFANLRWNTEFEDKFPAQIRANLAAFTWKRRLTITGQVESVEGKQVSLGAGAELKLFQVLNGRVGWQKDGPTFGGGLSLDLAQIHGQVDYAFLPDPLRQGDAQRFSLEIYF
jgi:hypothetical protein